MFWYADVAAARSRQIAADATWLLLTGLSLSVGHVMFDLADSVAESVQGLADGAGGLQEQLASAGRRAGDVPLAGRALSVPLDHAGQAAAALSNAATDQAQAIEHLGVLLGVLVALVPIVCVTWKWGRWRWRWLRQARTARAWLKDAGGEELLAWQALQLLRPSQLMRVSDDPIGGWRRGEPEVVRGLADLQLRVIGLTRTEKRLVRAR